MDPDLLGYSESVSASGPGLFDDGYECGEYEPRMREIYYLPIRDLNRIEELSDEEFDGLRESGYLIWSGVA